MDTIFEWFMLAAVIVLLFRVIKLESMLIGMKYTIDQIAKKVDIPEHPIDDELRELIEDDRDIEAVKLARETLGLSLVEGKQYIDELKADNE